MNGLTNKVSKSVNPWRSFVEPKYVFSLLNSSSSAFWPDVWLRVCVCVCVFFNGITGEGGNGQAWMVGVFGGLILDCSVENYIRAMMVSRSIGGDRISLRSFRPPARVFVWLRRPYKDPLFVDPVRWFRNNSRFLAETGSIIMRPSGSSHMTISDLSAKIDDVWISAYWIKQANAERGKYFFLRSLVTGFAAAIERRKQQT